MSVSAATDGSKEIIKEFVAESAEGLDRLDRNLVELERNPASRLLLDEVFRTVHTIKGNSAALGFPRLESLAHAGEDLLGWLRDGRLEMHPPLTSALLAMVDALRGGLNAIERGGEEDSADFSSLVLRLKGLGGGCATSEVSDGPGSLRERVGSGRRVGDSSGGPGSVRVDVGVLDKLMDLTGELVLARNQTLHLTSSPADGALLAAAQRLKSITSGLQQAVMKARLRPISEIWAQYPRFVRDLAAQCGKCVDLVMEGSETELDRTILEAIKGPLTHIIRNAIDHGIEPPEQRIQAGKAAAGCLRLAAFHQEGRVHVEVSDDGAGLDVERVRRRAFGRRASDAERAAAMSPQALAKLVFAPGFSTSERVTGISGRGVGLDVVKTNIESIGGTVDLQTVPGQGTKLCLSVPLTLAILPALIVSSGGERFAAPQVNLREVVRLSADSVGPALEYVCGAPMYRLRDRLLPLCFLDEELQLERKSTSCNYILVLRTGASQFGLVVDAIHDTQEIVIKPLSVLLRNLGCFGGAAVLGDGRVALILDVPGLAQMAGIGAVSPAQTTSQSEESAAGLNGVSQGWLICRGTSGSRFALPLPAVARLEEIPAQHLERSEGREVVQYRGAIMPLLRAADLFHEPEQDRDLLPVVVLRGNGGSVGLVVDQIEDIVEAAIDAQADRRDESLSGSAVIQGRVADVLDPAKLLALVGAGPSEAGPTRSV